MTTRLTQSFVISLISSLLNRLAFKVVLEESCRHFVGVPPQCLEMQYLLAVTCRKAAGVVTDADADAKERSTDSRVSKEQQIVVDCNGISRRVILSEPILL